MRTAPPNSGVMRIENTEGLMHKSRLGGLIIDCETDDLGVAREFWTKALEYEAIQSSHPADEGYVPLKTGPDHLHIELQKVTYQSRVHIDIEIEGVEAEVSRLEELGAKRVKKVSSWWVMEAPTGHKFCVVVAEGPAFANRATTWA